MKKLISAIDARYLSQTAPEANNEDRLAELIENAARSELTEVSLVNSYQPPPDLVKKLEQYGYSALQTKVGNLWQLTISW